MDTISAAGLGTIREALSQLRATLETSPLGAELIDSQGRVIFANQAYFRIFRSPPQRADGMPWIKRYPGDCRLAAEEQWLNAKLGRPVGGVQIEHRQDGVPRRIRFHMDRLKLPDFPPLWIRYSEDLSEAKVDKPNQVERESEVFGFLADQLPILVWRTDTNHHCDYVNSYWHEFTGATPQSHLGWGWMDFLHPEDRQTLKSAIESGSQEDLDYRLRRHDGVYRWFTDRSRPITNERGETTGYIGVCLDVTESVEQRETSRRRKRQLLAMVHHCPGVAIQWFDRSGTIQLWNGAAEQLFGFTAEEAIGRTFGELIHTPEEFQQLLQTLSHIEKTGQAVGPAEYHFQRRDGTRGTCLSTIFLIPSEVEEPTFCCMDVDITERKRTELALQESESKFRTLAENFPDAVFILDPSDPDLPLKIQFANRAVESIHGYRPEELIGQSLAKMLDHPQTAACVPDRVAQIREGKVIRFDATHIHRDGHLIPMSVTAGVIPWDGKRMIVGINRDMTLQRSAEEAAREGDARFRSAFYSSAMGMAIVGIDGRFLDANTSLCRMLGYSLEELKKLGFPAITHPDDVQRDLASIPRMIRGEIPYYAVEKRYRAKEGHDVPIQLTVALVRTSDGQPAYFVSQMLDLTERKQLEQELIQNQRLSIMRQMASGISHDFNNLLTVILGYCETLLEQPDTTEAQRNLILPIRESGNHASRMIRQLIAFSRRQPLLIERIDLNAVIRRTELMLRGILRGRVRVELKLADNLPTILADPVQIDQILINLAVNARDAMPEGGGFLVQTETVVSPEKPSETAPPSSTGTTVETWVRLRVSDTGQGIPPDVLPHIFEPFYTTKGEGKGHGLGLSVVHGIVTQCGGTIRVASEPGQGCLFEIDLPAAVSSTASQRWEAP